MPNSLGSDPSSAPLRPWARPFASLSPGLRRPWGVPAKRVPSQGQGRPTTRHGLSCYWKGKPEKEGKSSRLLALLDFSVYFYFPGSLRTRKGFACSSFVLRSDAQSVFTHLPQVGLTGSPWSPGQGRRGDFRLAGPGPPESGGSRRGGREPPGSRVSFPLAGGRWEASARSGARAGRAVGSPCFHALIHVFIQ